MKLTVVFTKIKLYSVMNNSELIYVTKVKLPKIFSIAL